MMQRKNVVLIFSDDLVWDHLEGMPFLASLDTVNFPQSTNTTPLCGPARSTLHTGLGAWTHGNANNEIGETSANGGWDPEMMLGRSLQRYGVRTGFVGKYINGYPWEAETGTPNYVPPGWNFVRIPKAQNYYSYTVVKDDGTTEAKGGDTNPANYLTDVEAGYCVDFINSTREPFALIWAAKAPHVTGSETFPPAPRHDGLPVTLNRRPNFNEADVSDKPSWVATKWPNPLDQATIDTYDADHANVLRMLMSLDDGISDIIDALTARGILDDTVVMFCADNSNLFGEHRHVSKGVPWEEAIGMHLRVLAPGIPGGDNDALVANIDIAPTVADLLGARLRYAPDGMSFASLLDGTIAPADYRSHVLLWRDEETPRQFGPGTYRGVRTYDGRKYVEHTVDGDAERYDLTADPYELTNIVSEGTGGLDSVLARLRAAVGDT